MGGTKFMAFMKGPWSQVAANSLFLLCSVLFLSFSKGTIDMNAMYRTVVAATSGDNSPLNEKIVAMDTKIVALSSKVDDLVQSTDSQGTLAYTTFIALVKKQYEKIQKKDFGDIKDTDLQYIDEIYDSVPKKYKTPSVEEMHNIVIDYSLHKDKYRTGIQE